MESELAGWTIKAVAGWFGASVLAAGAWSLFIRGNRSAAEPGQHLDRKPRGIRSADGRDDSDPRDIRAA